MKLYPLDLLLIMIFIMAFVLFAFSVFHTVDTYNNIGQEKTVECFDRFGNKIEGVECTDETTTEDFIIGIVVSIFVMFLILLIAVYVHYLVTRNEGSKRIFNRETKKALEAEEK